MFTVNRKELLEALGTVLGATTNGRPLPILANVHLIADGESVRLEATDLETAISVLIGAEVEIPVETTVPAKELRKLVKGLAGDRVTLALADDGSRLSVTCGPSGFAIATTDPQEFPCIPAFEPGTFGTEFSAEELQELFSVAYAASTDKTRFNLNGVCLENSGDSQSVRAIATDGHRLAYTEVPTVGRAWPMDETLPNASEVIVPAAWVKLVRKLTGGRKPRVAEFSISLDGNSVVARSPSFTVAGRAIEGKFPNWRQVVPDTHETAVTVLAKDLDRALKSLLPMANGGTHGVKLTVSGGEVKLAVSNPDLGDASDVVPAEVDGEGLEIGFNATYLRDALAGMTSERVRLELTYATSPTVVRGTDGGPAFSVVMPMRL